MALNLPFDWQQGQHMTLIGDTGTGKTTLAVSLLKARQYYIVFRSKGDDSAEKFDGKLVKSGKAFRSLNAETTPRVILYPQYEHQLAAFYAALETIWKEGGWCAYLDELWYLTNGRLKMLTTSIDKLLTQGRSQKITVFSGIQRPVLTTRFAMSQSTHLISFRVEGRDLKTLAETGNVQWAEAVESLERYQFAWYDRNERQVWVGRVQDIDKS